MKVKPVHKKVSIKTMKVRAWKAFSRFIRLRDCLKTTGTIEYGECVSCDETVPFKDLDAGHFVPKRSGNYFSERGVNAQCQSCNRYKNGNQLEYRRELIRRYGDGVDEELEREQKQIKKFTVLELQELEKYYINKTKELGVGDDNPGGGQNG